MPTGRPARSLHSGLVLACALLATMASLVAAADSPHGDSAAAWPSTWRAYTLANGSLVSDVIGDVGCGPAYCDVSSGPSGTASSVYFASNGVQVFFRIRVLGDPRDPSHGGFRSTAYVLKIAVNGTAVAAIGLDGKPAQRDFVYVSNADGSAYNEIFAFPFDNSQGESSAGGRAIPDGAGQYFVDWQVPLWRITARTGGAVTGSTPVQLFFGTSQAANLSVINKDFMIGNDVDFGGGATVTLVPLPPAPAPTSTPAPPASGGSSTPPGGAPTLPDADVPEGIPPTSIALVLQGAALALAWGYRLRRPG